MRFAITAIFHRIRLATILSMKGVRLEFYGDTKSDMVCMHFYIKAFLPGAANADGERGRQDYTANWGKKYDAAEASSGPY